MGGGKKQFKMRKCFVIFCPLVPLPTISSKNALVENQLVGVVHNLLGQVGCGAGVRICGRVIDLTPDDLNGVIGGVYLAEVLVVCEPVCIGDDGVGLVEVGKQIHRAGSAISLVRFLFYPHKVVLNGAQHFFPKGAVYVLIGVESECSHIVSERMDTTFFPVAPAGMAGVAPGLGGCMNRVIVRVA